MTFRRTPALVPVFLAAIFVLAPVLWTVTFSYGDTSSCIQCHTDPQMLAANYTKEPPKKSDLIEGVG